LKQARVADVNLKDTKDHLPMDAQAEAAALADYAAAGIKLHAAGTIYFQKDEDADIRSKFEYCKRAGIGVIVAGDPATTTLPRIEKFAKEYDIRIAIHNHGPEDKLWPSPLDVLKAVKPFDSRIGCCIDVGTRRERERMWCKRSGKLGRGCLMYTSKTWRVSRKRKVRWRSEKERCR